MKTNNDFNPPASCQLEFSNGFPVIVRRQFNIYFVELIKFPLLYEVSYVYQIKCFFQKLSKKLRHE